MEAQSFDWVIVDDNKVRHRWECPECNNYVYLYPWYYSEYGEPYCDLCGGDLEYVRTEYFNG